MDNHQINLRNSFLATSLIVASGIIEKGLKEKNTGSVFVYDFFRRAGNFATFDLIL